MFNCMDVSLQNELAAVWFLHKIKMAQYFNNFSFVMNFQYIRVLLCFYLAVCWIYISSMQMQVNLQMQF